MAKQLLRKTETAQAHQGTALRQALPAKILAAVVIGIAVGVSAFSLKTRPSHNGVEAQLVISKDIAGAAVTLAPDAATALVTEAKSCNAPLLNIWISKQSGTPPGLIRIRSGSYLSPAFLLTDEPQQIAIPTPAPYSVGIGTILVEGDATEANISLLPTIKVDNLAKPFPITTWWPTDKPC